MACGCSHNGRRGANHLDRPGLRGGNRDDVCPPIRRWDLPLLPTVASFLWQKSGVVRVFKNGALLATPFIDIQAQVNQCGDRGLLGLALDPNVATNGYVYLLYTFEVDGNSNDCGPKTSRLTRVTAQPTNPDVAYPAARW